MNIQSIRSEFPIFSQKINDLPIVYLDSAATSQKPKSVLDRLNQYYTSENANVHRGIHYLSQKSTEAYEGVREKVCQFLGTKNTKEIIFTKGTTDAMNLLSSSLGELDVNEGDTVLVTRMEHHSNFVPWQSLCLRKKAQFKIVELTEDGQIDLEELKKHLQLKPKILAVSMMSNTLGTINPIKEIASLAKSHGTKVIVDGAQGMVHLNRNISDLGEIDFLAFSAHKLCGPTGTGVLWGREALLNQMPPYQFGGDMILNVQDDATQWNELPWKFEAGTPNIAGAIGMGAALDYYQSLGRDQIENTENKLTECVLEKFLTKDGIKLLGPKDPKNRGSVFSFILEDVHPHDLSTFLDTKAIAIRAGHHCNQPLMQKLGVPATARASALFYNTEEEFDYLFSALDEARRYFA